MKKKKRKEGMNTIAIVLDVIQNNRALASLAGKDGPNGNVGGGECRIYN